MNIDALVCTFNEESFIEDRIINLRDLCVPEGVNFTIHVLDNGSTDATCEIAQKLSEVPGQKVIVHQLEPVGKCGALFWAFQNLVSDYFLLTDANTVFSQTVLVEVVDSVMHDSYAALFVGNFRSVKSEKMGNDFLGSGAGMSMRLLLEKWLNIFTGANGGCYFVKRKSLDGIWLFPPVRNDDFVISVFAACRGTVKFVEGAKAYEVESLGPWEAFRQKYRDALGHHQGISWLISIDGGIPSRLAIFFRIIYWLIPLAVGFALVAFLGWYAVLLCLLGVVANSKIRMIAIRTLALYVGYCVGVLKSPSVRWSPTR